MKFSRPLALSLLLTCTALADISVPAQQAPQPAQPATPPAAAADKKGKPAASENEKIPPALIGLLSLIQESEAAQNTDELPESAHPDERAAQAAEAMKHLAGSVAGADRKPPLPITEHAGCAARRAVFNEWATLTPAICDKASADAAAAWMEKKNAELKQPQGRWWQSTCPCMAKELELLEFTKNFLECAEPAYYGSDKLKAQLHPASAR